MPPSYVCVDINTAHVKIYIFSKVNEIKVLGIFLRPPIGYIEKICNCRVLGVNRL